jgi:hypothetical protein
VRALNSKRHPGRTDPSANLPLLFSEDLAALDVFKVQKHDKVNNGGMKKRDQLKDLKLKFMMLIDMAAKRLESLEKEEAATMEETTRVTSSFKIWLSGWRKMYLFVLGKEVGWRWCSSLTTWSLSFSIRLAGN